MILHGLAVGPEARVRDEKGNSRVWAFAAEDCSQLARGNDKRAQDRRSNGELAAFVAAEVLKKAADRRRVEPLHLFVAEVLEAHRAPEHVRRLLVDLGISASRDCVRSRQTHTISGSLEPDEDFEDGSLVVLLFDK
jgi:hypothetical protein